MRKGQDKKFNVAGQVSCLLLAVLLVAAVCPVVGTAAFAEEGANETGADDGVSTLAAKNSTVAIGFTPESANASVTPVDSTGAKAKVDVKATVRVQNSGGYSVYVGSSSSGLEAGSNVIPSVASTTTYADMPLNRWGYSFNAGETVKDEYNAMPATLRGTPLDSNTSANIRDETRIYMLSFAANIGADKPTGTYSNQVTMLVVSSPLEVANDFGVATMQEMTSEVCDAATDFDGDGGISAQLEDVRDGKYYWVSKLKDNKCWMTQNLDLDLSTNVALTPDDSDVTTNWTPEFSTAVKATSGTVNSDSQIETRSWSLGDYRIANPTIASGCGTGKASLADCPSQFKSYNTPTTEDGDANAHYIVGNYYQWNAATAGTGGLIKTGQATSSICPKGWKLPTGADAGELKALLDAYSVDVDVVKLTSSPLYFVRGGYVAQSVSYLFRHAGDRGYYWSSTPQSDGSNAYNLYFNGASYVNSSYTDLRYFGFSVRCIAQ